MPSSQRLSITINSGFRQRRPTITGLFSTTDLNYRLRTYA